MGRLSGFRYRDLARKLKACGFQLDRQAAGSHQIWFNPATNRYTTLPNADLITKANNWNKVFQEAFDRPESVRESFRRLGPVRLCTMHARPITKTELMLASAEITRLLIAIGDVDDEDPD